ncbi:hybrid sensor histidine kinase/response regulator [Pandoraea sp. PE-S2R-1]|uniref:hybrid sensor histidine kinase/response regulator n=1 Tax=Pandoraea sp. PE-S2R-1 TaxID=1986994 RepID=UPI000B3FA14A|nr:hybrid sensor histidine kinase/response regulator [Pandoraea sp. PE-S2R-1]
MTFNDLPNDGLDGCRDDAVMRTESAATEIDAALAALPSLTEEGGVDLAGTFRMALVHELRAPLQVLQGQLDALAGDGDGDGDASGADLTGTAPAAGFPSERGGGAGSARFDTMRAALDVLVRVVDDVLQLGQGDALEMPLRDEPFEVRAQLDGEVALFAAEARAKGLALRCDIDDEVPVMLRGDAVRLRQIVRTLLANALKYTAEGEVCVRASWRAQTEHLTVCVTDTGPGIPEGAREAVFHAFFRGQPTIPGTGLGLWIARRWAHRMSGALLAETPARGAHLRLSLPFPPLAPFPSLSPLSPPADRGLISLSGASGGAGHFESTGQASPVAIVPVREGLRVLVVEDHPINRLVLCEQLGALGCVVQGVGDAAEALSQWAACEVDVVLTDVQLGHACGLRLAGDLQRTATALHRLPPVVIAVTGSVLDARMARDAGIDTVLPKPVSRRRLQQALAARWPRPVALRHDAGLSPVGASMLEVPHAIQVTQINPKLPLYRDAVARGVMRAEMAKDIAQFRRLLRRRHNGDLAAAQAVLHRMQGACRMFGDPELLARCASLAAKLAAVSSI